MIPDPKVLLATFLAGCLTTSLACSPSNPNRIVELHLDSSVLKSTQSISVVKPKHSKSASVLFFLHGRGRNHRSLLDVEATRDVLLAANCWIILPDGGDGWYINSPVIPSDRYDDYLSEVIEFATTELGLPANSSRRTIGGWSMGGYGAVRYAQQHPEMFERVASVIGTLDFPRDESLPPGRNYKVPVDRFGSDTTVWQTFNPIHSISALRGHQVLIITAEDAFDRTMNDNFSQALAKEEIAHEYTLLPGGHTFDVVQAALQTVLTFSTNKDGTIP